MTKHTQEAPADERAQFEAWADDQGFLLQRTVHGDDYQDLRTQGPWDAWQARAALATPAAPERAAAEPVAWTLTETLEKRQTTTTACLWFSDPGNSAWTPLYAAPSVEREALTDEQTDRIADAHFTAGNNLTPHQWRSYARAVLAAAAPDATPT